MGVVPGTVLAMAERVQDWWARRQFSRGRDVPYEVGTYREAWAAFPALIRQYHPDLNAGIVLTQIPPAADVLLLWQCEAGHLFVATPTEQRSRPGRERRRSAWCPECTDLATGRAVRAPAARVAVPDAAVPHRPSTPIVLGKVARPPTPPRRAKRPAPPTRLCPKTPPLAAGEPFVSECAPSPASAVEAQVRADLFGALAVTPGLNAVRVARPFFDHLEVWPDFLLPELRIAVEYDSTGRHGLEHVGKRQDADERKDRALRAAGWEVVRIRTAKLSPLGPYDLRASAWNAKTLGMLLERFRQIRGPLLVDAYVG